MWSHSAWRPWNFYSARLLFHLHLLNLQPFYSFRKGVLLHFFVTIANEVFSLQAVSPCLHIVNKFCHLLTQRILAISEKPLAYCHPHVPNTCMILKPFIYPGALFSPPLLTILSSTISMAVPRMRGLDVVLGHD